MQEQRKIQLNFNQPDLAINIQNKPINQHWRRVKQMQISSMEWAGHSKRKTV